MNPSHNRDLLRFVERTTCFLAKAEDAITMTMVTHGLDKLSEDKLITEALKLSEELRSKVAMHREEFVNELIEEWHDVESPLEVYEYINMTKEDYFRFVETNEIPQDYKYVEAN